MTVTPTPEEREAIAAFLKDQVEVLTGTGKHADHVQRQIGRCSYCSCGARYPGKLIIPEDDPQ